jgi:hypothetical protein
VDELNGATTVRYINPAAPSPAWVVGPSLTVARTGGGGAGMFRGMANAWGNYIYVYGGEDSNYFFVNIMIRLDVTNLTSGWTQVTGIINAASMLVRYNAVSAALNGIFYYLAGFNTNASNQFVYETSSYDPSTNTWTGTVTGATLPNAVGSTTTASRGCAVALDGALYYMRNNFLLKWTPGDADWTSITTSAPWQNSGTPSCAAYNGTVVQMVGTTSTAYNPVSQTFAALPGSSTRNHNYPVAQTCTSATDPIGKCGALRGRSVPLFSPVTSSNFRTKQMFLS